MKRQQSEVFGNARRLALKYFNIKQALDDEHKRFDQVKTEFEEAMEAAMSDAGTKRVAFAVDDLDDTSDDRLVVTMVERIGIEWLPDKLEKRVPKEIARQIIKKHYHVENMPGLIQYLKSCGVDPNIFKQFIRSEKYVDQAAVDRLSELGMLSVRNVSGCYIVKCPKPYFKVSLKKGNGHAGKRG